jgi:hypothetical protein
MSKRPPRREVPRRKSRHNHELSDVGDGSQSVDWHAYRGGHRSPRSTRTSEGSGRAGGGGAPSEASGSAARTQDHLAKKRSVERMIEAHSRHSRGSMSVDEPAGSGASVRSGGASSLRAAERGVQVILEKVSHERSGEAGSGDEEYDEEDEDRGEEVRERRIVAGELSEAVREALGAEPRIVGICMSVSKAAEAAAARGLMNGQAASVVTRDGMLLTYFPAGSAPPSIVRGIAHRTALGATDAARIASRAMRKRTLVHSVPTLEGGVVTLFPPDSVQDPNPQEISPVVPKLESRMSSMSTKESKVDPGDDLVCCVLA